MSFMMWLRLQRALAADALGRLEPGIPSPWLAWAAWPCGLLQSALLLAALASGPAQGAAVMAVGLHRQMLLVNTLQATCATLRVAV